LSGYYVKDSTAIFAKTGTLSGVVALSGFLQTRKGKWLAFSVLVNNHQSTAAEIRRRIEKFLLAVRARY
jgi:D-alanyl-D-alanine carboxypeptidase/D-alanyl-D-alanine-endopeptidase (penicillin-binding protein 4)